MGRLLHIAWLGLSIALATDCATAPVSPAPGGCAVYGEVRLVPREGLPTRNRVGYGDRRLRDAVLVDYSRPGYAVVYADGPPRGGEERLTIRPGPLGTRIEPGHGAVGAGGRIGIRNASPDPHVVSVPASGLLRRLEPGDEMEMRAEVAGEVSVFVLDEPAAEALVFVSPGPYAVVSRSGRYALEELEPGRRRISAWHPRFPGATEVAELSAGARLRIDLELGVGMLAADAEADAGS